MGRNIVFYFSGTGNSLEAAQKVAAGLGDTELVFMKEAYQLSDKFDRIGFIFPCYAGGVPKEVLTYIKTLKITADMADYFFSIVTCGGGERNSLPMLRDALSEKQITLHYGRALQTVGNYIAMYPMKADVSELLTTADQNLKTIIQEIKTNTSTSIGKAKLKFKLFYKAGNMYFRSNAKKLAVSDSCTSCGSCEKLCPTESIKMVNGKPAFTWQTCSQCMACIQWCPANAINCGKNTYESPRYHHPDVNIDELMHK